MSAEIDENCCKAISLLNSKAKFQIDDSSYQKSSPLSKSSTFVKKSSKMNVKSSDQSIGLCLNCNLVSFQNCDLHQHTSDHKSEHHCLTENNCISDSNSDRSISSAARTCVNYCSSLSSKKMDLTSLINLSECGACVRHHCSIQNSCKSSFKCASRSTGTIDDHPHSMDLSVTKSSNKSSNNRSSNEKSSKNSFKSSLSQPSSNSCSPIKCSSSQNSSPINSSSSPLIIRNLLASFPLRSVHLPNNYQSFLVPLLLVLCTVIRISDACSARSTPKPRPPLPEIRPNITFQTYQCPEAYAKWYCLNGATCFFVRIGESILYNCECADGYMGQRCEFKDLEGSYLQSREKVLVETAKVAGGAFTVLVLFVFVALIFFQTYNKRKSSKTTDEFNNQLPFIT